MAKKKISKNLNNLFWINNIVFITTLTLIFTRFRIIYWPIIFSVITILGVWLILLTLYKKVKKPLKDYLLISGASTSGFGILTVTHNLLYALNNLINSIIIEALSVIVFLTAIIICPIVFTINLIYLLKRLKN